MMPLIKFTNGLIQIKQEAILQNIDFEVYAGERVALIGDNGVGKTTLLKVITGEQILSKGSVAINVRKEQIGVLQQDVSGLKDFSARNWVEMQNNELYFWKTKLEQLLNEWERLGDDLKVIEEYNAMLAKYIMNDGYDWEEKVERCLLQMGISRELWIKPFRSLSGGQKTRVGLAGILVNEPSLLLLDEPTNHIDFETVRWLSAWLKNYKGTVLFVSHNRAFIDEVASKTIELTFDGTKVYSGGYSSYKRKKEQQIQAERALYEKQQKEKKKLKEIIQIYKNWHQKAKSAASVRDPFAQKQAGKGADKYKAKERALERLEKESIAKPQQSATISAHFHNEAFSPKKMLMMSGVSYSYEDAKVILRDVNLLVERGDRIAVIGKSGSGKTTLLKVASGVLSPNAGSIQANPQLRVGYFMQELVDLNGQLTVLEEVMSLPEMEQDEARAILASFLFRGDAVYKQIQQLSMGERCRVAFVKLYFSDANLLVLDEPTNYLDIATRERIEEALELYEGAILVVSHDSYLLRKLCNKVVTVNHQRVTTYLGSYKEWEKREDKPKLATKTDEQQYLLELQLLTLLGLNEYEMTEEEKQTMLAEIDMIENQIMDIKKRNK